MALLFPCFKCLYYPGAHNYLQELIMSLPGFKLAVMLAYLEVLGVTICSYIELQLSGETIRKAPLSAYATLCFMLMLTSAASNISLNYINYPTKVVFRSCKIIPTLAISSVMNKKKVCGNTTIVSFFFLRLSVSLLMLFFLNRFTGLNTSSERSLVWA